MSALATDPHAAALVAAFRTDDGRAPGTPPEGTRRCDDGTTWRYERGRWAEEGAGPLAAEVREARAEAGRLRAALEPFARAAANLGRVGDGVGCYAIGFWHAPEGCPTAADFKRAAVTLAPPAKENP